MAVQVDKVVGRVLEHVNGSDLQGLLGFWEHLDARFFSRLGNTFQGTTHILEESLRKFYVVQALRANRTGKVSLGFMKVVRGPRGV